MSGSAAPGRPLVVLDALLVNRRPTGVGRSILELTSALAARDRELDFLVLATEPDMFAEVAEVRGWQVLNCPGARGGTLRKALFTQLQVPRICRARRAALLHSLQFVAPLRAGCPSVVTVHDHGWLRFPATVEQPRRAYYRFFVPRTLRRAAAIVTNSQATAAETAAFFPDTAARIATTQFGTPSWVWKHPGGGRPPAEGGPVFLFVGTLEPRKNLEALLEAYALFLTAPATRARPAEEVPRLLFIGGKGWKDSNLRRRMDDLMARGRLEVRDYCGTDELWREYRRAHALLFPSLHEGFGFPILEAMAAGLPVLTADRGAMVEVGGDLVLAVDPTRTEAIADGLAAMAWDDSLRQRLSAGGPERARQWSWERTAELTTRVYRRVLGLGLDK